MKYGRPFIVENTKESIDPLLQNILQKEFFKKGMNTYIKIGDIDYTYNSDFKLFFTCRMPNPHLVPE